MESQYIDIAKKLLWQLENDESLSYGDFQQKAELVKRGLDFLITERKSMDESRIYEELEQKSYDSGVCEQ